LVGGIGRLGWLRCVLALHVRGAGRARDLLERIADPRVNLSKVNFVGLLRDPVVGGFAEPVERRRDCALERGLGSTSAIPRRVTRVRYMRYC